MCSGDVRETSSGDVPATFWQFSALQTRTPLEHVVGTSPKKVLGTPRNFLALLAPMARGRGGYPHSRDLVLLQRR